MQLNQVWNSNKADAHEGSAFTEACSVFPRFEIRITRAKYAIVQVAGMV
jgi:hypothetical protein